MAKRKDTLPDDNITYIDENGTATKASDKRRTKHIRAAAIAGLLLTVALIALIIIKNSGWLSAERIALRAFDAGKKLTAQDNLPIEMNGLKVLSVDDIGYCVGVLDDIKYTLYSPEYNEICTYTHNLSFPTSVTTDRRALIFERGNRKLTVVSRKGVVSTRVTEFPIISADINKKNMTAVVTTADRYLGAAAVYNEEGDTLIEWFCPDNYITDIALSPDGRRFAVSLLRSENGVQISGVRIFNIGEENAAASFEFASDAILDIVYDSDGGLCAIGTSSAKFVNSKLEMTGIYDYGSDKLAFFDTSYRSGVCALVFEPQPGQTEYVCRMIKDDGQTECELKLTDPDFFTVSDGGDVYICREGKVYMYRRTKTNDGISYSRREITASGEAVKVLAKEAGAVILSIDGLDVYAGE